MRYNSIVAKSHSGMIYLQERFSFYCEDNFFNSIMEQKFSEAELENINTDACAAKLILKQNLDELVSYYHEFLNKYSTSNNDCYKEAKVYFEKMRKSMNKVAGLFKNFYQKLHRRRMNKPTTKEELSIYRCTRLLDRNVQTRIELGIPYPDIVYTLQNNISDLVHGVLNAISLCLTAQEKESEMKKDNAKLLLIYNTQFNEVAEALGFLSAGTFILDKTKSHIPSHRLRQPEELKNNYHGLALNDFKSHVACAIAAERDNQLATTEEIKLWQSKENVLSVRFIAEHFDDILDERCLDVAKAKEHVTELIYYVVQRYGANTSLRKRVECFTRYFTESNSKSRFALTKKGAVYSFSTKSSPEDKAAILKKYDEIIKPMLTKNGEIAI